MCTHAPGNNNGWVSYMDYLDKMLDYIRTASINDAVDILIVAFLIYKVMKLLKDTSAERLIKGVFIIFVVMQAANVLRLTTISYMVEQTLTIGITALIIIFQPELRRVLEQIGKGKMVSGLLASTREHEEGAVENCIVQTAAACEAMSWTRTGALIVFERTEKLGEIVKNGTYIDAAPSAELLKNIFYPKSPLHDGAMIVRDGRVLAAGCVLPLSGNQTLSKDLGTRHRAAVGMSEVSDSVLVVVSEETGSISVAIGGMLKRHLAPETLEKVLRAELLPAPEDAKSGRRVLKKWRSKAK